jgi:hypothetical protein
MFRYNLQQDTCITTFRVYFFFAVHQLQGGAYLKIHLTATLNFNGGDVNASGSLRF